MSNDTTFSGKNYIIVYADSQFILDQPQGQETFDSFEELVESHPVCEESREFFFDVESEMSNEQIEVCGRKIEYDKSGVGHCWVPAEEVDCPSSIQEEIAGEIIDGDMDSCEDFVASNGVHYRW